MPAADIAFFGGFVFALALVTCQLPGSSARARAMGSPFRRKRRGSKASRSGGQWFLWLKTHGTPLPSLALAVFIGSVAGSSLTEVEHTLAWRDASQGRKPTRSHACTLWLKRSIMSVGFSGYVSFHAPPPTPSSASASDLCFIPFAIPLPSHPSHEYPAATLRSAALPCPALPRAVLPCPLLCRGFANQRACSLLLSPSPPQPPSPLKI